MDVSKNTYIKLIKLIISAIEIHFILHPFKLRGPNIGIQIDETMLNWKVKSHRGRSPREQVW